jgi:hypothetical protein
MSYHKRRPLGAIPGLVEDDPIDILRGMSTQRGVSTTKPPAPAPSGGGLFDTLRNIAGNVFSSLTAPKGGSTAGLQNLQMMSAQQQAPMAPMVAPGSTIPTAFILGGVALAAVLILKKKG